jgi:threonine aldolase
VDVEAAINPNDSHYARTSLVCLEDTCNKGGGSIWDIEEIKKVSKAARSAGLAVHLDGARLWNAIVARGVHRDSASLSSYASNFDSISLCLSKGLGCPVGSVLLGSKSFIAEAHRVRKVLGGGMRQAGIVASAGTYAIEHHLDRLAEDHSRALALGEAALQHPSVKSHAPIDTNIVIIELEDGVDAAGQVEVWAKKGIKCFPFSRTSIRFVTHLDITDAEVEEACRILKTN